MGWADKRGNADSFTLLFGRVTERGGGNIVKFTRALPKLVQGFLVVETRVKCEEHLGHWRGQMQKGDLKLTVTPASQSPKSQTGRGEELALMRPHLVTTTFDAQSLAAKQAQQAPPPPPPVGFCPTTLHLMSGNFAVVAAHFSPGVPPTAGVSAPRLKALTGFLTALADPRLVMADWNAPPNELDDLGWPALVGGTALAPAGCERACDKGKGSMIDYGVASTLAAHRIKPEAFLRAPWATRAGALATIKGAGKAREHPQMLTPQALPARYTPLKAADPSSKGSRRTLAAMAGAGSSAPSQGGYM